MSYRALSLQLQEKRQCLGISSIYYSGSATAHIHSHSPKEHMCTLEIISYVYLPEFSQVSHRPVGPGDSDEH